MPSLAAGQPDDSAAHAALAGAVADARRAQIDLWGVAGDVQSHSPGGAVEVALAAQPGFAGMTVAAFKPLAQNVDFAASALAGWSPHGLVARAVAGVRWRW